ncbi:MAG: histidine kinase [Bacteroidota bacterium]
MLEIHSLYKYLFICCIFQLLFQNSGIGQDREVFFKNYREESGLDYHLINDIDQDSLGRLWLASYNGLYCYNGYEFENIKNQDEDKNNQSSNLCTALAIDVNENIWVGTRDQGLSIYHPRLKISKGIPDSLLEFEGKRSKRIKWIEHAQSTTTYVVSDLALYEFNGNEIDRLSSRSIDLPNVIKANEINCILYHQLGFLLLGTQNGFFVYDQKQKDWMPALDDALKSKSISSMDIDEKGQVWIGAKDETGVYIVDVDEMKCKPYPFIGDMSSANRIHVCHDQLGYIWIAAGRQGVYRHHLASKSTAFFEGKDYDLKPGNFTNFTRNPFLDSFGNVWFCGGGMHKWSNTGKRFVHFANPTGDYQSTSAIYDDKDFRIQALWGHGIVVWSKEKDTYHHIDEGLISKTIYAIAHYRKNEYLICGAGGCQVFHAKELKVLRRIPIEGTQYEIVKRNGQFFIAGSRGIWSWSSSEKCEKVVDIKGARGLVFDDENAMWIATLGEGLYCWQVNSTELINYRNNENEANSLQGNRIEDIDIDKDGILWLATSTGIEKFNSESGEWTNFLHDQELANIRANGVVCLNPSEVWISNNNYISRFNTKHSEWTHFNQEDGIVNPYFYERGVFLNDNGELFFAGRKGITHFNSENISKNRHEPRLFFEEVAIDGTPILEGTNPIIMNWRNSSLKFDFTAVHLSTSSKLKYSYRLLPDQKEWISIPRQSIYLNNIGSGEYTLEISAETKDGVESKETLIVNISVRPPIWEIWYAWAIAFLILASGFFFWNQKRINDLRSKSDLNLKLKELEQTALQSQMNPHFIFNAMSGIQYFILENDEERALKYLAVLGKLIRKILDYSNQIWISLEEEIELIEHYAQLEKLRFSQSIDIDLNFQIEEIYEEVFIPPLLLQPIVENAFAHGLRHLDKEERKIKIRFSTLEEDLLKITVEDNGVGRANAANRKDKFHNSKGSQNVRKRLELVGQQMGVKASLKIIDLYSGANKASGTKVELVVPIKRV